MNEFNDRMRKVSTLDYSDWGTRDNTKKYRMYTRKTFNEISFPHRHTYIEFFYVTEGKGVHVYNRKSFPIEVGAAGLLIPKDVHGFTYDGKNNFHHIDILMDIDYFKEACSFFYDGLYEDILSEKFQRIFTLSFEQIATLNKFVPYMFLPPDNLGHIMAAKSLLTSIIDFLFENYLQKTKDDSPEWLISLLSKLNASENFNAPLSDLTKEFAYNADYMRRIFKKNLGTTMTDYFNRKKMDYALHLLQTTDLSIESICETIGFNNISHFYHLFKRTFNKTPSEIRKF